MALLRPKAQHLVVGSRRQALLSSFMGDRSGRTGKVGGEDTLAFLSCGTCLPSWEIKYVPIDKPPWSVVDREGSARFKCPGCGRAVAWRIHGPTWRPSDARNVA